MAQENAKQVGATLILQGGDEDIEVSPKIYRPWKEGVSKKTAGLGGMAQEICLLQKQHMTSPFKLNHSQLENHFNDLYNSAKSHGLQI